jgi:uncharacterized protein YgbK (DUF1537 family)
MPHANRGASKGTIRLPPPGPADAARIDDALRALADRLSEDQRRVVILDDDPTGTQTSSAVDVLLDPTDDPIAQALDAPDRSVFVLTNSRSLDEADAVSLVRGIASSAAAHAARRGVNASLLLRGDSTLRGHVFAEIDAIGGAGERAVFCPAFPEGGRVTVGGRQLIRHARRWTPVSDTEFARDPVFGYTSEFLVDWVHERGQRPARMIDLDEVRRGPTAVAAAIGRAEPGTVVIPEAIDGGDIAVIAHGILDAERAGAGLVVRSSASLASTRAGLVARPLRGLDVTGPVLVVCGSHTAAATRQLQTLVDHVGVQLVVLPTSAAVDASREWSGVLHDLRTVLRSMGVAVLATERTRRREHGTLSHGAAVMDALVGLVGELAGEFDALITKGGITSAEVARRSLGARRARVRGQLLPGVAVWDLDATPGNAVAQVIVPGNVGGPETLTVAWQRISIAE